MNTWTFPALCWAVDFLKRANRSTVLVHLFRVHRKQTLVKWLQNIYLRGTITKYNEHLHFFKKTYYNKRRYEFFLKKIPSHFKRACHFLNHSGSSDSYVSLLVLQQPQYAELIQNI